MAKPFILKRIHQSDIEVYLLIVRYTNCDFKHLALNGCTQELVGPGHCSGLGGTTNLPSRNRFSETAPDKRS